MIARRALGSTGLEVSAAGLGGHLFPGPPHAYYQGHYGRRFVESEAAADRRPVIAAALEAGINLFAADFDFEARALGRILRDLGALDRVVLTAPLDFRFEPDREPDARLLIRAVETRRTELGAEILHLPQVRVADWMPDALLAAMAAELETLAQSGRIASPAYYSGDRDTAVLLRGLAAGLFPVVFRGLSVINPTAGLDVAPRAREAGAGFIGFLPFQKGRLFDIGREAGLTPAETAALGLSWALGPGGADAVLCGAAGPGEVRINAAASGSPFVAGHLDRLTAAPGYARFLEELRRAEPQLVHDWRARGAPREKPHAAL